MDLRTALAVLGVLVVAWVALSTYGRDRLKRQLKALVPWSSRLSAGGARSPATTIRNESTVNVSVPSSTVSHERKILRQQVTAAPVAAPPIEETVEEPFGSIDFIMFLPGTDTVSRDAALGVYKQNEYVIDKPHRLYGKRHGKETWGNLARDAQEMQYDVLALAMQLADRSGAVTESDLNAVSQVGLKLADALNRDPQFNMTFEQAMERAIALDKFCCDYDVIATINVVADSVPSFRGAAIERAAHEVGLEFGLRNIFHRKSGNKDGCPYLYSLANLYKPGSFDPLRWDILQTQGLTLFMPVPCALDPVAAFGDMAQTGKTLARLLGGKLFDQDRRLLSDTGLRVISEQIAVLATRMSEAGIPAGTLNAARLFPP